MDLLECYNVSKTSDFQLTGVPPGRFSADTVKAQNKKTFGEVMISVHKSVDRN